MIRIAATDQEGFLIGMEIMLGKKVKRIEKIIAKDSFLEGLPGTFPRTKRKKKAPVYKEPEAFIQQEAELICRPLGIVTFHIPEFMLKSAFERRDLSPAELYAAREASEKVKGFPDLVLFYCGFYRVVELKVPGRKPGRYQREWLKALNGVYIDNIEEFKKFAEDFVFQVDEMLKILEANRK